MEKVFLFKPSISRSMFFLICYIYLYIYIFFAWVLDTWYSESRSIHWTSPNLMPNHHNIPLTSELMSLIPGGCWKNKNESLEIHLAAAQQSLFPFFCFVNYLIQVRSAFFPSEEFMIHWNQCSPIGIFFLTSTAIVFVFWKANKMMRKVEKKKQLKES